MCDEPFRRLTIEEVKAAMDKTGLKLKQHITLRGDCGCPIVVVGVANDCLVTEIVGRGYKYSRCADPYETARKLDLDMPYVLGLIYGFDGNDAPTEGYGPLPISRKQCELGYADGQAIAAALLSPEAAGA